LFLLIQQALLIFGDYILVNHNDFLYKWVIGSTKLALEDDCCTAVLIEYVRKLKRFPSAQCFSFRSFLKIQLLLNPRESNAFHSQEDMIEASLNSGFWNMHARYGI